jgi:hypothetical protein
MKKLALCLLFIFQAVFVFAQNKTIVKGKVVDSKSQTPLVGAKIMLQTTEQDVVSNTLGEFSFSPTLEGTQVLVISLVGYTTQNYEIQIEKNKTLDVGYLYIDEDITSELQLSLVTITENDLGDDNSGSESTAGLLQASRDVFQQAAAFNWGQARFRMRGLDNEYGTTMINGVTMNKIYDGRPQWSNWGGLNDATRNQEFTLGTAPSDYTFGGILGTQEINTRASLYRKGIRLSYSSTNTNYSSRAMATMNSGLTEDGWAYSISGSRRWAQEGYFEGTDYAANSLFASVEKRFNNKHSLNFTSIYAQNSRAKTSPNTDEVNALKGIKYNSYWGYQGGKKRNSRDKDIEEPILMLSHYWKMSDKTNLTTNLAYQTGSIGNSRFDYQGGDNPDPTYYKNLPSYFSNLGETANANLARDRFINGGQINWNALYSANLTSAIAGRSVYALYEDRTDDTQISANSFVFSDLSENIKLNAGLNFRKLKSENFQYMTDLLGGQYFNDVDLFYQGDQAQSDLNNPNRQIQVGDKYGYNYNLRAIVADAFTQFKFSYKKTDFYLAQTFSRSQYEREGLYRNGIYASNSFGKSGKLNFENFGFKAGFTWKVTGQHLFDFNGAYMTKAPNMRNSFANARINNNITPDLTSEQIASVDASYIIKLPKFKSRITGFASKIQNATEISFFYAEGVGEDTDGGEEDAFISELLTGIDKQNVGIEFGAEYQITSTFKASIAASYGQYLYANNPNLKINDDAQASPTNTQPITNFGTAYLKNYRLPGMPQTAASFGLEYRDPKYWWIGANANYMSDSYLDVSNILRTDNFTIDGATGDNFTGANVETVRKALKQEKFAAFNLINVTGGKSWRVNATTIGVFASVNNVLDETYKTGGFEQSRKATFPDQQADNANNTPSFGSKYFYGYGRTYFVNLYVNF